MKNQDSYMDSQNNQTDRLITIYTAKWTKSINGQPDFLENWIDR